MAGFGEKMRRERELRGISLDQIATATKISTRMLKALEDEKFDLLPGGIFNKGFIRAYAKFLGIDEEQAIADYVAANGPEEPVNNLPQIADIPERPVRQVDEESISWTAIVVLVLLVAGAYAGWTYHNHRKADRETRASAPPATIASAPAPIEQPAATPASATATPEKAKTPSPPVPSNTSVPVVQNPASLKTEPGQSTANPTAVDLVIRTSEESWVQAIADGKTVLSDTLPPSAEKHVTAARRITLTVGNAGGVQVSYNGATLPELGGSGKVRTIVFSPTSFEFQSQDQ